MSQNQKTRQITVAEMAPHVHSFAVGENKVNKISDWLTNWIISALNSGMIKPFDFLPSKGELAFHIGVSLGTIQNVYRTLEDAGLVESKQKIGTYIKGTNNIEKLSSKREVACELIKKYIKDNSLSNGDFLVSVRKLSKELNIPNTTLRIAVNTLIQQNIIESKEKHFVIRSTDFEINNVETENLVQKIADNLKNIINTSYRPNEKLPSNFLLAQKYNVSIKTIHDAVKLLEKEGILRTKRGNYGTFVANPDSEVELYNYEKIEAKIRHFIIKNYKVGDKLPPIRDFAKEYNVSTKTIKKALDNLAEDGYVAFSRGRIGGTFVLDIPQKGDETYTWLAINPDYIQNARN
ncbi:GntR family transcriptional regulator [bacterium]|nr:GntR family transcriptional regulator [bacterium]